MNYSDKVVFFIAGILLALIFFAACMSPQQYSAEPVNSPSALQNSSATLVPTLNETNSILKEFPPETRGEIQTLAKKHSIALNYWGFDPVDNEIDLLARDIPNTSAVKDLQGKQIGNYTVHVFNNTDLETSGSEVRAFFTELKKNPEYQIDDFRMVNASRGPYINLWYNRSTLENKKLDNTVMKGWKIFVSPRPLFGEENLNISHGFS